MDNYKEYLNPKDHYLFVKWPLSKPVDPDWIEIPEGADCLMQWPTGHKVFYRDNFTKSWNNAYKEWHFVIGDDGIDQSSMLWKRTTQDPALISGDVALANVHKHIVQYLHDDEPYGRWTTITDNLWSQYHLGMFLDPDTKFKFRFKPQTIKVELELPKPFEPRDGDECFIVDSEQEDGFYRFTYSEDSGFHQNFIQFGAYRTEDDVKKAVEQLRKIRGTNS